jgi:hypothetical protein
MNKNKKDDLPKVDVNLNIKGDSDIQKSVAADLKIEDPEDGSEALAKLTEDTKDATEEDEQCN